MANHVHFSVNFHRINDDAKAKLKEMFGRIREDAPHKWFSDIFVEGDTTYEMTEKYEWTTSHIGPKWSYFEDYDAEGEPYFNGEAAWGPPTQGVAKLLEILSEFDPKMITSMTYEDEGPNFVGADVWYGDDHYDGVEYDDDEIIDMVIKDSETLTEDSYNKDECEWIDDDAEDTYRDEMWEVINDKLWDFVMEEVKWIEDHPEDFEDEESVGC